MTDTDLRHCNTDNALFPFQPPVVVLTAIEKQENFE
jgi:hypothetical protein